MSMYALVLSNLKGSSSRASDGIPAASTDRKVSWISRKATTLTKKEKTLNLFVYLQSRFGDVDATFEVIEGRKPPCLSSVCCSASDFSEPSSVNSSIRDLAGACWEGGGSRMLPCAIVMEIERCDAYGTSGVVFFSLF